MRFLITLLIVFTISCAIPLDKEMSANEGNDATVAIVGCGYTRTDHLFCRSTEGSDPEKTVIRLIFPKALNCDKQSCVEFQLFRLDGTPGYAGAVKKGEREAVLNLSQFIGHDDKVILQDEGEYLIGVRAYYTSEGIEYSTFGKGYIRLQVLAKGYKRLACNSPVMAWKEKLDDKCDVHYTTGFRSAKCCGETRMSVIR